MTPSQKRRQELDQAVAADYVAGMAIDALMEKHGLSRGSIFIMVKRAGVVLNRGTGSAAEQLAEKDREITRLRTLYQETCTLYTEAKERNDAQIKHMVARFLSWRLPENFNPDGGISFKATFNEHTAHPMKHEPTGTNLFGADQAEAMIRHMLDDLPAPGPSNPPGDRPVPRRVG